MENWPPDSIWLIDLAIEGFSATQSTRISKELGENTRHGYKPRRVTRSEESSAESVPCLVVLCNSVTILSSMMMVESKDPNSITTSLLTLLNVSAIKPGKRKQPEPDFVPSEKLNKRKTVSIADSEPVPAISAAPAPEDAVTTLVDEIEENTLPDDDGDEVQSEGVCFPIFDFEFYSSSH